MDVIRGRLSGSLDRLTNLEAEVERNKRREEEEERIDTLGQDSDAQAIPWVQKELNTQAQAEKKQWEIDILKLQALLKHRYSKDYFRCLADILIRYAKEEDIPKKYVVNVDITDQGIVVRIRGTKFVGAFKPCGLPSYDHFYCRVMAMRLGNTTASLEGYRRKSDGGILLPDDNDLKEVFHGS